MRHTRHPWFAAAAAVFMASCAHEVVSPVKASPGGIEGPPLVSAVVAPMPPPRKSSEAFAMSARPEALRAWLTRIFKLAPQSNWSRAETQLDLPPGTLSSPTVLADLGVDTTGIVTLETFEIDARAAAQAKRFRGVDVALLDDALSEAFSGEAQKRDGWFLTRIRVPIKTGSKLRRTLESSFNHMRASRWQSPSADVGVFGLFDTLWVLRDRPGSLEIELAMGHRDLRGTDARAALLALSSWGTAAPIELGESDVVAKLHPSAIAEAGLWLNFMRVLDVASADEVEAAVLQHFLAEGFREATQTLRISAPAGAPRYEDVRVSLEGDTITIGSSLASNEPALEASTWATDGPGVVDFALAGPGSSVSVNGALAYGWPLLPKSQGLNPLRGETVKQAVAEAGFPGAVLVVGDLPFLAVRLALEGAEPLGQATLPFMRRFERLGVVSPAADSVFFGLLATGATEEQAACALARDAEKCAKAERIGAKGTTSLKGFFVERKRIDGRWVVAASRNKPLLEKTQLKLQAGARPALRATVDLDAMLGSRAGAGLGRWSVVAERRIDTKGFEVTCRPAP